MGLTEYPYRRFLLFSAIGGIGWAIYTCALAYWISTAIADFALASILISGLVTTIRKTRGEDIDAACGQLAGRVQDRTKRQIRIQRASANTAAH